MKDNTKLCQVVPGPTADKTADCHEGGINTIKDNTELCQVVPEPPADKQLIATWVE
jgi:hypothetical protein